MKYEVRLHWSETDKVFVAEAPELEGCTAHGATYEEALEHIQQACALWLKTAEEDGIRFPRPDEKSIANPI